MKRVAAAVFSASLLTSVASAEQIPGSEFSYANWMGSAYTFVGTGNFSHCSVQASYLSGDVLHFSVNAGGTVGVGVQSNQINLTVGETFPVVLQVDNFRPFFGTATAATVDFAVLSIPDFEAALLAFQKGRMLRIESQIGQASYDLTGTYRALDAAKSCAFKNMVYSGGVPNGGGIPSASFDKTVLFQVATQMISDLQVSDSVYLTDQQAMAEFQTDGVFWTSAANGITGGVASIPKGTLVQLSDTDGQDVSFLSKRCGGDMATTFRSIPIPDILAREIRAVCLFEGKSVESRLTKALIGDNVLYTLLVFSETLPTAESTENGDVSANAAIRAASFIKGLDEGN